MSNELRTSVMDDVIVQEHKDVSGRYTAVSVTNVASMYPCMLANVDSVLDYSEDAFDTAEREHLSNDRIVDNTVPIWSAMNSKEIVDKIFSTIERDHE